MHKGVLREREDVYYLSFEEFREVVKTNRLDYSIIAQRKEEYEVYEKLTPPRVMTSEGEVILVNTIPIFPRGLWRAYLFLPVSSRAGHGSL